MPYTVFDTPVVVQFFRLLSLIMLRLTGWTVSGKAPESKKSVMLAVPHTSNWDFLYMVMVSFVLRQKIYWMGKDTLFKGMLGPVLKWFGGVPVNRRSRNNLVDQMVDVINDSESIILVIPPEGTRGHVDFWKTGFYHIALGAKVPIACAFLDWGRRSGGVGLELMPSGDVEKDFDEIRAFYNGMTGKRPEYFSIDYVRPKPADDNK
ncbi:MAG: glycerol acyltransferase [Moraxellaceae bacterium]|nr:MAG: glycerol acyltransferase [Moraxellaceae bacterium]